MKIFVKLLVVGYRFTRVTFLKTHLVCNFCHKSIDVRKCLGNCVCTNNFCSLSYNIYTNLPKVFVQTQISFHIFSHQSTY